MLTSVSSRGRNCYSLLRLKLISRSPLWLGSNIVAFHPEGPSLIPDIILIYALFLIVKVISSIISIAKEAFNRKRSIFCGPLEKELRKRLVKCFVWSVALYGAETWILRRNEQKWLKVFEMWIWRRMDRVKRTDKTKNAVVLERVGEERIILELIKKRKINSL